MSEIDPVLDAFLALVADTLEATHPFFRGS